MERLPSLNAVRYFEAAARHRSFTAAAQELHVTQGAVSRLVQSLEEDLQVPLFTRNGRFIRLTPAGEQYHAEVSHALQRIAAASLQVRRSATEGALNVIVNAGFAARWLVPRMSSFQQAHPGIHVNLLGSEVEDGAHAHQATVTIRYGRGPWPGQVATRLPLSAELGVVCSPALLARCGPMDRPEDLIGKPLLAYTGGIRDIWQDYFDHFGLPTAALQQARQFYQLLMLTEAAVSGLGFALAPLFLLEPELQSGRLVRALPQPYASDRAHYILHPKALETEHKVKAFKHWLMAQARVATTSPDHPAPG